LGSRSLDGDSATAAGVNSSKSETLSACSCGISVGSMLERLTISMVSGAMLAFAGCLSPQVPRDPTVEPHGPATVQEPPVPPRVRAPAQATHSSSPCTYPPRVDYDAYIVERRQTHPAGRWQDSPLTKWNDALQGYESWVKPTNQHALNSARCPFALYLIAMHNRIHPIFADEFVAWLDTLPSSDPRNNPQLVVRIEVATGATDGRIVRMGVVRSSGVASFDAAALDAVDQAAPFGPAVREMLSSDGNVYFHWEFHRDPIFACSTINARPYLISVDRTSSGRTDLF
jgi:TonB family protein